MRTPDDEHDDGIDAKVYVDIEAYIDGFYTAAKLPKNGPPLQWVVSGRRGIKLPCPSDFEGPLPHLADIDHPAPE